MSNTLTANTIPVLWLSPQALAWAREHGSAFLRFWAEEGERCRHLYGPEHETGLRLPIERGGFCRRRYNEERARKEAPGWSVLDEQDFLMLYFPPSEALELLAKAREQFPKARLRQIYRDDCIEFVVVADAPWPDGDKLVFDDKIVVALKDN